MNLFCLCYWFFWSLRFFICPRLFTLRDLIQLLASKILFLLFGLQLDLILSFLLNFMAYRWALSFVGQLNGQTSLLFVMKYSRV